jgi:hypothetical protein
MDDLWGSDTELDVDTFIARLDDSKVRWAFCDPERIRKNMMSKLKDVVKVEFQDGISE